MFDFTYNDRNEEHDIPAYINILMLLGISILVVMVLQDVGSVNVFDELVRHSMTSRIIKI